MRKGGHVWGWGHDECIQGFVGGGEVCKNRGICAWKGRYWDMHGTAFV